MGKFSQYKPLFSYAHLCGEWIILILIEEWRPENRFKPFFRVDRNLLLSCIELNSRNQQKTNCKLPQLLALILQKLVRKYSPLSKFGRSIRKIVLNEFLLILCLLHIRKSEWLGLHLQTYLIKIHIKIIREKRLHNWVLLYITDFHQRK